MNNHKISPLQQKAHPYRAASVQVNAGHFRQLQALFVDSARMFSRLPVLFTTAHFLRLFVAQIVGDFVRNKEIHNEHINTLINFIAVIVTGKPIT